MEGSWVVMHIHLENEMISSKSACAIKWFTFEVYQTRTFAQDLRKKKKSTKNNFHFACFWIIFCCFFFECLKSHSSHEPKKKWKKIIFVLKFFKLFFVDFFFGPQFRMIILRFWSHVEVQHATSCENETDHRDMYFRISKWGPFWGTCTHHHNRGASQNTKLCSRCSSIHTLTTQLDLFQEALTEEDLGDCRFVES